MFLTTFATNPFSWNTSPHLHFLHLQWHLLRDLLFLLSMGTNIIHPFNGMRKRGFFKTLRPMLHTPKRTSRWAHFFSLLANWLILCFVERLMVGHCHFVVVCSCWNFEHCMIWLEILVWSCCALCFGAFLNCWVIWYETWTMLMTNEVWQCM